MVLVIQRIRVERFHLQVPVALAIASPHHDLTHPLTVTIPSFVAFSPSVAYSGRLRCVFSFLLFSLGFFGIPCN
ncbi:hypothetical protein LshimejAT787_0112780 [Lyophyllum shimeji]|uniref:Uncharacterized protein n=1 Tax=Lyophyllum shimeji TaxID=47721 RepID=A0A9P3PF96_LYOSH|nr:hypothetical protein LshimejAT787_0112780 [Lyophyllum shimeji]